MTDAERIEQLEGLIKKLLVGFIPFASAWEEADPFGVLDGEDLAAEMRAAVGWTEQDVEDARAQ